MGLADPIEAVVLYQLDNPAETGFHVGRQDIELFSNPVVQQFYDPRHLRALLHFCNSCRQPVLAIDTPDGVPIGTLRAQRPDESGVPSWFRQTESLRYSLASLWGRRFRLPTAFFRKR